MQQFKVVIQNEFPKLEDTDIDVLIGQGSTSYILGIVTHEGNSVTLYMVETTPVMFEVDNVLYPSLHSLWKFPHILPSLTTRPQLVDEIVNGADLMLRGVVVKGPLHSHSYGSFEEGDRIAINTTNNRAAMAVGRAALSSGDMYMATQCGRAVKVVHTFGDKLWGYGIKVRMPSFGPSDGYKEASTSSLSGEDDDTRTSIEQIEKRVSGMESEESLAEELNRLKLCESCSNIIDKKTAQVSPTEEMDSLLEYCFVKGLKLANKKFELPVQARTFYKSHMITCCPMGSQLDIKKSSYRTLSKFLTSMEKKGVVITKKLTKGVESIVFIDQRHQMFKDLLELEPPQISAGTPGAAKPMNAELYTVTAEVLPILSSFGFSWGDTITMDDLRKFLRQYVKKQKLQDPVDNRLVNVDEPLLQIVQDPYTMAVTWDDLLALFVANMSHGYKMNLFNTMSAAYKEKLEPIDIQIFNRKGNMKVTQVNNLELYGVNIQEFARACMHGVGAGSNIGTVEGKMSQQIVVQGNQVNFIGTLLKTKYQIPTMYIRGLENASHPK